MIKLIQVWQTRWKLAVAVGLVLVVASLVLLAYALTPAGEPLRVQATLAPTLFTPLPAGGLP